MTMTERSVWVTVVVFPLVGLAYLAVVLSRATGMPVAQVSWEVPMLWAMGLLVVSIVLGTVASAIATGVRAAAAGEDPQFDEGDVRDAQIEQLGNARAFTATSVGGLAGIILAMLDADPFWIANAIFLAGIVGGVVGAVTRLRAYRAGF